mgnify:CR=1 FL=1
MQAVHIMPGLVYGVKIQAGLMVLSTSTVLNGSVWIRHSFPLLRIVSLSRNTSVTEATMHQNFSIKKLRNKSLGSC